MVVNVLPELVNLVVATATLVLWSEVDELLVPVAKVHVLVSQ
jgi:hypothetical protein